jgi:hypothetical protein
MNTISLKLLIKATFICDSLRYVVVRVMVTGAAFTAEGLMTYYRDYSSVSITNTNSFSITSPPPTSSHHRHNDRSCSHLLKGAIPEPLELHHLRRGRL